MSVNGGSPEGRESFVSPLPSTETGGSVFPISSFTNFINTGLYRLNEVLSGHLPNKRILAMTGLLTLSAVIGCGSQEQRDVKTTALAPQATATTVIQPAESTPTPGYKLVLPGIQKSGETAATPTSIPTKPAPAATEAPATAIPEPTATPESFYKKGIVYAGSLTPEGSNKPTGAFILYSAPLSNQQIIYFTVGRQCSDMRIPATKAFTVGTQAIQGDTLNQKFEDKSSPGNLSLQESAEEKELKGTLALDRMVNIGPGCPLEKFNISAQQKGSGLEPLAQALLDAINTFQGGSLRSDIPPQKLLDILARSCPDCNLADELKIDKR